jgi:hypothetical protein
LEAAGDERSSVQIYERESVESLREQGDVVNNELVFRVEGSAAKPAERITLVEAGLFERQHLQEWVVAHPEMLGEGVMVVTMEFDRWATHSGQTTADRLDVLGLDRTGRLVVAELKREVAPEPTVMQAVKYAAMVSRFSLEELAESHAKYRASRGEQVEPEDARERLNVHTDYKLDTETLANPRVVLLAADFPPTLTATVVWLNEQGVDFALRRFQAYRTVEETLLTVSQLYPVPDVEEFTIAPRKASKDAEQPLLPEHEWTEQDFVRVREITSNPTVLALLDLTAKRPGDLVSFAELMEWAARTPAQARGDLAGLTMMVKRHFERSNWPVSVQWIQDAEGKWQAHYVASRAVADAWLSSASPVIEGDQGPAL